MVLAPLTAVLIQLLVWPDTQPYPWLLSAMAVLIAAGLAGPVAGLGTTLVAAVLASFFLVPPQRAWLPDDYRDLFAIGVFLVTGTSIALVVGGFHNARLRAKRALHVANEARMAAEHSEQRFRDMIDYASDGVFVTDPDGRYVMVNQQASRMLGYTQEELLLKSVIDLIGQDEIARWERAHERCLDGERNFGEWWLRCKNGDWLPVEISAGVLPDGRCLAFARDVSERQRMQRALAQTNEQLRRAQEVAKLGSWQLDVDRGELTWSEETYRIFGVEPGTPMDFHLAMSKAHPDDRPKMLRAWQAAVGGEPYDIEHRVVANGQLKWVRELVAIEYDQSGRVRCYIGTVQDITRVKQVEHALRESEQRWRLLLESTSDGIFGVDLDGNCTFANPAAVRMLGYGSIDELVGKPLHRVLHGVWASAKPHSEADCRLYGAFRTGRTMRADDERFVRADGTIFDAEYHASPITLDGQVIGTVARISDITERKRAETLLRQAAIVFDNTGEGIVVTDAQRRVVAINQAFTKISGFSREDVQGRRLSVRDAGHYDEAFYREILGALQRSGQWQGEVWNRRKNGELYPAWENISVVKDAQGRAVNYVVILSDISPIKEAEERLRHLAHHDVLTGLPNRLLFGANLTKALQRAKRYDHRVALLFLDLDRFKIINDTLGHGAGDELLKEIARRLGACVRANDTVARLGGDEFTVILEQIGQVDDAAHLAAKLIETVAKPVVVGGREVVTSTSIGISLYPDDANEPEGLVKAADAAMYRAKERGRNVFDFYTPEISARTHEHLALENGLRRALAEGELELFYQPQVAVSTGRIVGVEALLRWHHTQEGLMLPGRFIKIAEESDLIARIGRWVIGEVCSQARAWRDAGVPPLRIGINLSGRDLAQDVAATLRSALSANGLEPGEVQLEVEVTETVLHDTEVSSRTLAQLRDQGVRVAIDDFGTGYSSLGRLKHLPIDTLKIDQLFVRNLAGDPSNQAITQAVVKMGQSLGLKVIAEGVETEEQLAFLRAQGCDEVQGYLMGRPMPADALMRGLERRAGAG